MDEGANAKPAEPAAIQFRPIHYIYAAVLAGASLGMFGANGVVPAAAVLGIWALVFSSNSRRRTLLLIVLPLSAVACCVLLPDLSIPRAMSDRMSCSNHLKQIAIALHNYHDSYQTFPPAFIPDADGNPMHSWRVLIVPFIESSPLLWDYDFHEPWDGPNNSKLASRLPQYYACPAHGAHTDGSLTSYVAVVDSHTAWPETRAAGFRDVIDGTSNTLLVLEVDSPGVNWMEPRDVSYEEAMSLLTDPSGSNSPHRFEDFFRVHFSGRQIALADGSVRFVRHDMPADMAQALLLRDDGGSPEGYDALSARSRLRLDNCIRIGVFVLIALWPLPWVWINPRGSTPTSRAEPSQAQ